MDKFESIKKEKSRTYEAELESERRAIVEQYGVVEDAYNGFVERRAPVEQFVDTVGRTVLGIEGQHASAQIYAYELLLKALAEAEDTRQQDLITQEVIYDVAASELPTKKEYLLGLLAYYASQEREGEREDRYDQEPSNAQLEDEIKIFQHLSQGIARMRGKGELPKEMQSVLDLMVNDFPRGTDEGAAARLVATYYAKEPHATRPPDPKHRMIIEGGGGSRTSAASMPWYVYTLPPGYHTSEEKIGEARVWGIPLHTDLSRIGERERSGIVFDLDPEESLAYITQLRTFIDARDWEGATALHTTHRQQLWDRLDPAAKQFFGHPEETHVLVQTIRDFTPDDAGSPAESSDYMR
ncbi:MAG: hypothetical protein HY006_01795 [Candidatus Sungbacteria bacterium]|nr:hypothetical protein [Candidatus Sungbacteria bacterium]